MIDGGGRECYLSYSPRMAPGRGAVREWRGEEFIPLGGLVTP